MIYRDTRSMVRSPDGDTPYFQITTGNYKETRLNSSFIICLDYVLRKSQDDNKQFGLTMKKYMSSRHPAIYITDTNYADDSAITSENFKDANTILLVIEKVPAEIELRVNADKTEYISLKQNNNNDIQSLTGKIKYKYTISSFLKVISTTLLEINGITLIKKWYNPVAPWYTIYGIPN